jgi:mannose/fructose/N-acetylgalactosamine-specific phosphotransferase system component IID
MTRIKLLYYSFFVQTFWNYHTMASIGACYLLDKLLKSDEIPKSIRLRLIIFFNGHPYLVPYAISAVGKEIKDETNPEKINRFIDSVVGMLGAIGDQYYWNGVKPVFLLIPCLSVLIFQDVLLIYIIISISFVSYNFIQINERIKGIVLGSEFGFAVVSKIRLVKERWGYQYFAKISFLIILIFSIVAFIKYVESYPYIIFAILFIAWGLVSSRRGNSYKYLAFSFITYCIMEFIL